MRQELLAWFAQEGLLLQNITTGAEDPEYDEIKVTVRAPIVALGRGREDFRECPDPVAFGYPESCLDLMTLDDFHWFILRWFEGAVAAGRARCFVCNQVLDNGPDHPWDAVFVSADWHCWLVVHFDCKRYLGRDLKGRNPFEVELREPEMFDLRLTEDEGRQ
ncbi:hypothetical protein [Thermogemmatispora onikobensis]|uniref:hypothetical protein n=1 Tax=Thermogemmatispora onikobensis TaxID=732234 RepID=UPI0008529FEA|nr:hypothetical protein [Thermogemmatispora onikobensis]